MCAAAAKGKGIARNACASHHYGGNDDRDPVQSKFLHRKRPSVDLVDGFPERVGGAGLVHGEHLFRGPG